MYFVEDCVQVLGGVDEGNGEIFINMVKGQKKRFSESQ